MSIENPSKYSPEEQVILNKLIPLVEGGVSLILTRLTAAGIQPGQISIKLPKFATEAAYAYFLDITKHHELPPLTWAEHAALQAGIQKMLEKLGWSVETILIDPKDFVQFLDAQEAKTDIQPGEAG